MRAMLTLALAALLCTCGGGGGGSSGGGSSGGSSSGGSSSGGGSSGGGSTGTLITVDSGVRYQTISGWEAAANVDDHDGEITKSEAVLYDNTAVDQAGITRLRLVVRSGVEGQVGGYTAYSNSGGTGTTAWHNIWYQAVNDNTNPRSINWAAFDFAELDHEIEFIVLPMRDRLAARGEKLFLDVVYVAFLQNAPTTYTNPHEDPAEYAEFALATMLHLDQKYNLKPDAWEVINEPDVAKRWDGVRLGQSIVATAQRFNENNIQAKFIAPSTTSMQLAATYFDEIATVSGAVSRMSELSYHRYKGVSAQNLAALKTRAEANSIGLSMLEWWFGYANIDILFEDLTAGAVAFEGRTVRGMFNGSPGGPLTLRDDIRYNSAIYRAVRPGAVRVGSPAQAGSFKSLAFMRPDGRLVAALRATAAGTATIRGLSSGNYVVTTVTDSGGTGPADVSRAANGDITVSTSVAALIVVEPK